MITRRFMVTGAAAGILCAPSVVRACTLMSIRGAVMPLDISVHYGFVQRLSLNHRFKTGQLDPYYVRQLIRAEVIRV